jgi:hypothetical protein
MMSVTSVSVIILNVVAPFRICPIIALLRLLAKTPKPIARVQETQPSRKTLKVQGLCPP